jgi:hypothetical protein
MDATRRLLLSMAAAAALTTVATAEDAGAGGGAEEEESTRSFQQGEDYEAGGSVLSSSDPYYATSVVVAVCLLCILSCLKVYVHWFYTPHHREDEFVSHFQVEKDPLDPRTRLEQLELGELKRCAVADGVSPSAFVAAVEDAAAEGVRPKAAAIEVVISASAPELNPLVSEKHWSVIPGLTAAELLVPDGRALIASASEDRAGSELAARKISPRPLLFCWPSPQ